MQTKIEAIADQIAALKTLYPELQELLESWQDSPALVC
jgi:hypothetical protein